MFASDGVINALLGLVGIDSTTAWLGRTDTAIWTLILLAVWQFGSSMLIFLAGLKPIPVYLSEAAPVDGAGAITKFFKVTPVSYTHLLFDIVVIAKPAVTAYHLIEALVDYADLIAPKFIMISTWHEIQIALLKVGHLFFQNMKMPDDTAYDKINEQHGGQGGAYKQKHT